MSGISFDDSNLPSTTGTLLDKSELPVITEFSSSLSQAAALTTAPAASTGFSLKSKINELDNIANLGKRTAKESNDLADSVKNDTMKLQNEVAELSRSIRDLQSKFNPHSSEFQAVKKSITSMQENMQDLTAQTRKNADLTASLDKRTLDKVESLSNDIGKVRVNHAENMEKLNRQVEKQAELSSKVSQLIAKSESKTDELQKGLQNTEQRLDDVDNTMRRVGNSLSRVEDSLQQTRVQLNKTDELVNSVNRKLHNWDNMRLRDTEHMEPLLNSTTKTANHLEKHIQECSNLSGASKKELSEVANKFRNYPKLIDGKSPNEAKDIIKNLVEEFRTVRKKYQTEIDKSGKTRELSANKIWDFLNTR